MDQPPVPHDENSVPIKKHQENCRKYIWGKCYKHTQCIYQHKLVFEEMKKTLRFCHDLQNLGVCGRPVCNFLHASLEEQNAFINKGILPKVLAQRYAMIAAKTGDQVAVPPPPPPPTTNPPPPPTSNPPPPQPQPPPTSAIIRPPPPMTYVAQPVSAATVVPGTTYNIQPAPSASSVTVARYDPSRPPPVAQVAGVKRGSSPTIEAGPRKAARVSTELKCTSCDQRKLRIKEVDEEIANLLKEEADIDLEISHKSNVFKVKKHMILKLCRPENVTALEDYIEGISFESRMFQDFMKKLFNDLNRSLDPISNITRLNEDDLTNRLDLSSMFSQSPLRVDPLSNFNNTSTVETQRLARARHSVSLVDVKLNEPSSVNSRVSSMPVTSTSLHVPPPFVTSYVPPTPGPSYTTQSGMKQRLSLEKKQSRIAKKFINILLTLIS